ncbi:MAG: hypothetical protein LBU83_11925 [Bacteroidales bacterium]|jgi:hypothetical protein|nr:hypothetical protein [Bacteroidales bacterium]
MGTNNKINVINSHVHPLLKVIEWISVSYSEIIENIIGVYNDGSPVIQEYSYNEKVSSTTDFIPWAIERRKETKTYEWVDTTTLPFKDAAQKDNKAKKFDDVTEALIIYCKSNPEQNENDLVILYPKFTKNVLLTAVENFLPHYKKVLSYLMERTIKTMLPHEYEIHSFMKDVYEYFDDVKKDWEHRKNEQQQVKGKKLNNVQFLLGKLNSQSGVHISLSEEVELDILNFEGDIKELENKLTRAVKFAINRHPSATAIKLDDFLLAGLKNIEDSKTVSSTKPASSSDINRDKQIGQFGRIKRYLYRLEDAVKATLANREKPIGINFAAHMSVSPPAISDFMKKNRENIIILLLQEKLEWPYLRENFKPIVNLLEEIKITSQTNRPPEQA